MWYRAIVSLYPLTGRCRRTSVAVKMGRRHVNLVQKKLAECIGKLILHTPEGISLFARRGNGGILNTPMQKPLGSWDDGTRIFRPITHRDDIIKGLAGNLGHLF